MAGLAKRNAANRVGVDVQGIDREIAAGGGSTWTSNRRHNEIKPNRNIEV